MKPSFRLLVAAVSFCASSLVSTGIPLPGALWKVRNRDSLRMAFNDVVCNGSGRMVAVGDNGVVRISNDHGATWTRKDSDVAVDLDAVTWTGSQFVAVGGVSDETCLVLKSTGGDCWLSTCLAGKPMLHAVAAGNPTLVAGGERELLVHSEDLVAWNGTTNHYSPINDVVWTGDQFVAVGDSGTVKTSPDGETWTSRSTGLAGNMHLKSVAWSDSLLTAVGRDRNTGKPLVLVSADGISWTQRSMATLPDFDLFVVEWTGSAFVAMGQFGHTLVSPDGTAWSHHSVDAYIIHGLCWDGSYLVAVGKGGEIFRTAEAAPTEEGDWTRIFASDATKFIHDMATGEVSGESLTVAVGDGGQVLESDDEFNTTTSRKVSYQNLNGIAATGMTDKRFIVVGSGGAVLTSPDSVTWTSQTSGTTQTLWAIDWFTPFFGDPTPAHAIAVGSHGTILTSENGVDWTSRTSNTTELLREVAVGSIRTGKPPVVTRRVVAVGNSGTILYSSNGTTWHTVADPDVAGRIYSVAALRFGFVAVGANGMVLTSNDGIEWDDHDIVETRKYLHGVAWTGNQVVAVGTDGIIYTSPDGKNNWTRRYGPTGRGLEAVAALDSERLVVAGGNEIVITSDSTPGFREWILAQSPPVGQNGPDDDPNGDGITNLLAYAMDIPAVAPTGPDDLARLPRLVDPAPGKRMVVGLAAADSPIPDLAYIMETSPDLRPGNWTEVLRHMPGQLCSSGSVDVMMDDSGDSSLLVFPESIGDSPRHFIRMRVEETQ